MTDSSASESNEKLELNLYLDDWRQQPTGFILAKTYEECILLIQEFDINVLSLDYHLGGLETGYDVARFIVDSGRWPNQIFFHTSDRAAQQRMYDLLSQHAPPKTLVSNGPYELYRL